MLTIIIKFSIRYRRLIVFLAFATMLFSFYAIKNSPLDAIPDISDSQIIIYTKWPQASKQLEVKITRPIIRSLTKIKGVRTIRGMSYLGYSFIYVILEVHQDIEEAKKRVTEKLSEIRPQLPDKALITVGSNASSMGWIFQYSLVNKDKSLDLREIRLIQEERIKLPLETIQGVAEVATVGGLEKQYQLKIYPQLLAEFGISLKSFILKIKATFDEVGGRVLEVNNRDYQIRGTAPINSIDQIESIVLGHSENGKPIQVKDIGYIQVGYDIRRGIADFNGEGEVVGGIVVIEQKENVLTVMEKINEKLAQIQKTLPKELEIVTVYDRSELILKAISTFFKTLGYELAVVALVIFFFLRNLRTVSPSILILFLGTIFTSIPLYFFHQTLNLFSIAGLFLALGEMADASIVMVENCASELAIKKPSNAEARRQIIVESVTKMARPLFFSMLIIMVSFLPVFFLGPTEGKLFDPLALSKTFAMFSSTMLTFVLLPALLLTTFNQNLSFPASGTNGFLASSYKYILKFLLKYKYLFITVNIIVLITTIPILFKFENSFLPDLDEGSILYMPTTLPGLPAKEAGWVLQQIDKKLKNFPEVKTVFGKLGRADTATDPAPFTMVETTITLLPKSQWRPNMTREKLIDEMNLEMNIPGFVNAWTQPIRGRVDMQSTGIQAQVGLKVKGKDIEKIEFIAKEIEKLLSGTHNTKSVIAERISDGYFIDTKFDIYKLAREGISVEEAMLYVKYALGGENVATLNHKGNLVPLNIQYAVDYINTLEKISELMVVTPDNKIILLSDLAEIEIKKFPEMVRNEDGMLAGYVYIETTATDAGSYVEAADKLLHEKINLEDGYKIEWAGQFLQERKARKNLSIILPVTLLIIFILLKYTFRSTLDSILIMVSIPFAMVGGVWLQWALGYPLTVAVWVGYIALFAVAVQTGIIMIIFLRQSLEQNQLRGNANDFEKIEAAIMDGSVQRLRPKLMTVITTMLSLLPIMLFSGSGLEIMKPIATPTVGGIITSALYVLFLIPCLYAARLELSRRS